MASYTINGSVTGTELVTSSCGWASPTDIGTLSCDVTANLLMLSGSGNGFEPPRYFILTGGPPIWSASFPNFGGTAIAEVNATDPTHPFLFFHNAGARNGATYPLLNPSGRGFPDGAALAPGCWSTAYPNGFFHFVE